MTDNRICAECGAVLENREHEIFGGSPTFHGFIESGRRSLAVETIAPPAVRTAWDVLADELIRSKPDIDAVDAAVDAADLDE